MRSLASFAAALLAAPMLPAPVSAQAPQLPPEAGTPTGPSATAGAGASSRYDGVMVAQVDPGLTGLAVASGAVSPGEHVEVTALSSGRTVLLPVVVGTKAAISPAAAQLLGIDESAGVRIRAVTAGPSDAVALRQGLAASPRLDTPEVVLRALRRQLPAAVAAAPARRTRVPKAPTAPVAPIGNTVADIAPPPPTSLQVDPAPRTVASAGDVPATRLVPPLTVPAAASVTARFVVNVQTVAREEPARNAARTLRGTAIRIADGWLVRLGPFAGLPTAQAARDDAVARGYADAAIFIAD